MNARPLLSASGTTFELTSTGGRSEEEAGEADRLGDSRDHSRGHPSLGKRSVRARQLLRELRHDDVPHRQARMRSSASLGSSTTLAMQRELVAFELRLRAPGQEGGSNRRCSLEAPALSVRFRSTHVNTEDSNASQEHPFKYSERTGTYDPPGETSQALGTGAILNLFRETAEPPCRPGYILYPHR